MHNILFSTDLMATKALSYLRLSTKSVYYNDFWRIMWLCKVEFHSKTYFNGKHL